MRHGAKQAPVEVVALGISVLALEEALMKSAAISDWGGLRVWVVARPWIFLAVGGAVIGGLASGARWRGMLVGALTICALVVLMLNFRGLWIWPGTFDYYFGNRGSWIWALPGGFLCGLAVASMFHLSRPGERTRWAFLGVAACLTLATYVLDRFWSPLIESMYAPTRAIAYTALLVPLVWIKISEESE